MSTHQLFALIVGVVVILAAWLPVSIERRPVSLPVVLVVLGAIAHALPLLSAPDPRDHLLVTERLTEAGVLVALLGTGLALDRPIGLRRWATTWRLLSVGMVLSIAGIALVGALVLGLDPGVALLLGAVLAPTDPVLASDVQVGEPVLDDERLHDEDEVRFALTSEAGLNDALAFPFVWAGIALVSDQGAATWQQWLAVDLVWRLAVGIVVGVTVGWVLGRLMFGRVATLPPIAESAHGFVALGATLVAYGAAESLHGYGFLSVFACAVALRHRWRTEEYHSVLHQFTVEIEQVVSSVLLVVFGGVLLSGVLAGTTWRHVAVSLAVLIVIRPLAAGFSLVGSRVHRAERRAIAFFGIRGVGSIYYLAFAAGHGAADVQDDLWIVVCLTVSGSVVVHGVTASGVMRRLDRRRRSRPSPTRMRRPAVTRGRPRPGAPAQR